MGRLATITRRSFLVGSAAIAGGVAFGTYQYRKPVANPLLDSLADGEAAITPYVKISAEGITLITPRADLGQGSYSVQAHLLAEELDVDPHAVNIDPGMPSQAYFNGAALIDGAPFPHTNKSWLAQRARDFMYVPAKLLKVQMTGGSSTVPDSYTKLRMAGAVARETLKQAAAEQAGVSRHDIKTENGQIILPDGSQIRYEDLAAATAGIEPITDVSLRPESEWRYLGNPECTRTDMIRKCTGTETYGIDLVFDDMLYASVRANPGIGGKLNGFDASAAESMRGVQKIVPISGGVAVVADNTWRAIKAVNSIEMDFGPAPYPASQQEIWDKLGNAFDGWRDNRLKNAGDVEDALAADDVQVMEAEYRVPFLAHAPMEPLNAVVRVTDDKCEIWTGTQIPVFVQEHAAKLTGLDTENVFVYVQPMGGSFGLRLEDTYVMQAVEIAMAMKGKPVKMTWSREEDMTHDYPRPAQIARVRGAVREGQVVAYDVAVSSPSVVNSWMGRLLGPIPGPDITIVAGVWDQPFAVPNYRVTGYRAPETVPVTTWRSVGNSGGGFLHNGFLDELMVAAKLDPMDELIRLCTHDLSRKVLEEVKAMSGWDGSRISDTRARGVSFTMSYGVSTAEVVEITQTDKGIKIDKVYLACEVGKVLDPVNFEAQLTGGVIWGLGHAMNCELTYKDYAPQQLNYHAFQGMRMYQTPVIEVKGLENGDDIRGIGEPAVPPAASALANAIFALNGKRIRELPLNKQVQFV